MDDIFSVSYRNLRVSTRRSQQCQLSWPKILAAIQWKICLRARGRCCQKHYPDTFSPHTKPPLPAAQSSWKVEWFCLISASKCRLSLIWTDQVPVIVQTVGRLCCSQRCQRLWNSTNQPLPTRPALHPFILHTHSSRINVLWDVGAKWE